MGGTFGDGEADEKPVHEVCVKDFYLGKYEVTQHQWEQVMGKNPAFQSGCGPDCPVENISFNTIQEFIGKLNDKKGAQLRLPTEAEWEYAARSGGKNEKWAGTSNEAELTDYAWYTVNSDTSTHPVGLKKPNGLGLFDMSGNVREWCLDWYAEDFYGSSPKDDPTGPADGQKRVLRGGIFADDARMVRTTSRANDVTDVNDGDQGFRLVRPVN
jgi:formylglycine-generating enzyme required for sulfatase activity